MRTADLLHLLPLLILGGGAVVTMVAIAAYRRHGLAFALALGTLVLSLLTLRFPAPGADASVGPLIEFDGYAVFFMTLIFLAAIAVVVMAYGYMNGRSGARQASST
jgi:NADH-quinone oxidoreductase subunit N